MIFLQRDEREYSSMGILLMNIPPFVGERNRLESETNVLFPAPELPTMAILSPN